MSSAKPSAHKKGSRTSDLSSHHELSSLSRQVSQRSWIEKTFYKRECIKYIPSHRDPSRCSCGRSENWHVQNGVPKADPAKHEKWHPTRHTEQRITDAYGTIEFQGGPHPSKAQYMRLSSLDTKPENVLTLLIKHWGLELPKLLITVQGGILNFELQPKLKRIFRKGLLKAARTTGAWIITNGTNTGVTRHVGDAISDRNSKARNKVVAIGIAPWGIVENKEDLIGRDIVVPYHCVSSTKTNTSVLNSDHSYFLLADNGTTGKYGGEIMFRKKFEKHIAQQKISIANDYRGHGVPVICVVLEGGANTIRSVFEYVTDTPPIPVVVCDGSGRAADLLAFTHKYTMDDGTMAESLRDQLILTIQRTFLYTQEQAEKLFIELMLCVKKKELITVFRMGDREESKDIDLAILTALLKGTTANAIDQLNLALTWDRVDIARSHIFVYGQEWPAGALEVAMMDALINDRVDFVKLLLENGVSMHTFLTIPRLEDLYNSRQGPTNTLRYLVRDIRKHVPSNYRFTLPDIGSVLQHLMGGGFRSAYCRKRFRQKYQALKQATSFADFKNSTVGSIVTTIPHLMNTRQVEELFPYPFHDLMIWAVLMKRQKMALFMWQHGEEALAKALLGGKLYAAMAHEADQDDLEIELSQEFRSYSDEFLNLALELLEHCYKIDDDYTQQLLTYELKNFSEQTCLGLAVMANHRRFIAHTCCQVLLNDLWIGGLRMRKNTSLKVILGIVFPPYIFKLDFKSKEELQLMPQTMEEHLDELEDAASLADMSLSSFSENQDYTFQDDIVLDHNSAVNRLSPVKENGMVTSGNGTIGPLESSMLSPTQSRRRKSPLRMGKKVYEFYNAPVTKFWAHAIGYMIFLVLFSYVILERLKEIPNWAEIYIMAFIITMGIEKIRQIIVSEPVNISMKLGVYIMQFWNILDTLGITLFLIGIILRFIPATLRDAQLIYCLDIIFWNVRILEILSVNKYLGPYVKIMGKLMRDMCYFLTILFIAVTSFGLIRQTVNFENKKASWHLRLRNVWYYPYWMIYGELFAEEIDPCDDPVNLDSQGNCIAYASWLAPFSMFVFLLVANILMVNLLIARFNATFIRNNAMSKEIWMFQRYDLILQYELRPIVPPPFILITHIFLAFKYIKRRCKGKRDFYDNGLKLFLSLEDTEKLHDFEEECMEDLHREKDQKHHNSIEERIKVISERVENISLRLDDMNVKENHLRLTLGALDHRMTRIDDLGENLYEAVRIIKQLDNKDDRTSECSQEEGASLLHPRTYSSASSVETGLPHPRTISTCSTDVVDKSQGSPLLVHSKRKITGEQLTRLTRKTEQRRLSSAEYSTEITDQFIGETTNSQTTSVESGVRFSLGSLDLSSSKLTIMDDDIAPIMKEKDTKEEKDESLQKKKMKNYASQALQFVEPIERDVDETEHQSAVSSEPDTHQPEKVDSLVSLTSQSHDSFISDGGSGDLGLTPDDLEPAYLPLDPAYLPLDPAVLNVSMSTNIVPGSRLAKLRASQKGQSLNLNADINAAPFASASLPQPSTGFTSPDSGTIPPTAVRDLSLILTPLIGEYTSITDNIDTSCIEDLSPPCSPAVAVSAMFPDKFKEGSAASSKQKELKQAEELEHQNMEMMIRHRLRQISQVERGSFRSKTRAVATEHKKKAPPEEPNLKKSPLETRETAADLQELCGTQSQGQSTSELAMTSPWSVSQLSNIEDEATAETLQLFRDRVLIKISQPSQDIGDTQSP